MCLILSPTILLQKDTPLGRVVIRPAHGVAKGARLVRGLQQLHIVVFHIVAEVFRLNVFPDSRDELVTQQALDVVHTKLVVPGNVCKVQQRHQQRAFRGGDQRAVGCAGRKHRGRRLALSRQRAVLLLQECIGVADTQGHLALSLYQRSGDSRGSGDDIIWRLLQQTRNAAIIAGMQQRQHRHKNSVGANHAHVQITLLWCLRKHAVSEVGVYLLAPPTQPVEREQRCLHVRVAPRRETSLRRLVDAEGGAQWVR
mmetsp:Transcript_27039/g.45662  ORF Transcript_27039/g.45662 Transcript_27039/m.45662 type:complete len:255 (-) Transcript_27039:357-1121(-)